MCDTVVTQQRCPVNHNTGPSTPHLCQQLSSTSISLGQIKANRLICTRAFSIKVATESLKKLKEISYLIILYIWTPINHHILSSQRSLREGQSLGEGQECVNQLAYKSHIYRSSLWCWWSCDQWLVLMLAGWPNTFLSHVHRCQPVGLHQKHVNDHCQGLPSTSSYWWTMKQSS